MDVTLAETAAKQSPAGNIRPGLAEQCAERAPTSKGADERPARSRGFGSGRYEGEGGGSGPLTSFS